MDCNSDYLSVVCFYIFTRCKMYKKCKLALHASFLRGKHFEKYAYSLSCRELDENTDTIFTVC